jgi:ribosomal protein S18 acetylase RimI-like enzyme
MLIGHVEEYAKSQNCDFVFLETMSFQALDFYEKLGFKVELKRDGYAEGASIYYLKKNLVR